MKKIWPKTDNLGFKKGRDFPPAYQRKEGIM